MVPMPREARLPLRRLLALLVLLPSVSLAVLQAVAAIRPAVKSPHGDLKEECSTCHSAEGWKPARIDSKFDHARFGFALTGAHASSSCMSCHSSLDFKAARTQCQSCHNDPHRGEMGADCARCHGSRSFIDRGPMVRAHQLTRFPLTGSHAALECETCHKPAAQGQLQFVNTKAECQSCHLSDYQATTVPAHASGGYPLECQQCHSTLTWSTARFNHDQTAFPLTGTHRSTACAQCHGDGVYKGKPTACASCHQSDYNGSTAPPHAAAGFPLQCQSCHGTVAWQPSSFDHSASDFPLTGAHRTANCNQCHGDGVYDGKSSACQSCHQGEYNGTSAPPHAAAGFPLQCQVCHSTTAWQPTAYDHNATDFPLTGAHRAVACNQCHGDGVYDGKPTACESCHTGDYNATTNPSHSASRFPLQCLSCHNTNAWAPSSWDHDAQWFPIYSGAHRGRWSACSTCHTSGSDFTQFTCLSCHPHSDRNETDGHHRNMSGYSYTSQACYSCHPRGRH